MKNGRFCAVNDRIYVDYFRKIEAQVVDFNWLMKNVLLPAVEEDKRIAEAKGKAAVAAEAAETETELIFDTPEQVRAFYRYARTKFFNRLVVSRLSSHSSMPQAYQDVPLFTFTEADGIDWDASIPELDKALIKHFGLGEHEAYFMAVEKPYARAFDDEMLAKLEAAGVDVTGINEWYEE